MRADSDNARLLAELAELRELSIERNRSLLRAIGENQRILNRIAIDIVAIKRFLANGSELSAS